MDQKIIEALAFANLPSQICPLTGNPIKDAAVMHRDLSDWWPTNLHDMRDDRIANLIIVERNARERYYNKLKNSGIVLSYSGGLDSTTVLHWCLKLFGSVHCLIFNYSQRHSIEIDVAVDYLNNLMSEGHCLSFSVVDMSPINKLASSSLTRFDIQVPLDTPIDKMSIGGLPSSYVPGRNVYFMTAIAQTAYQLGWRHIAMGVNALDYSGYPDCRPEFMDAMRSALSIGVFNGIDVAVHAPLMFLNKKNIIRLGNELKVNYRNTHSCYNGVIGGCGRCDSCILRRNAFAELGMVDPSIQR